MLNKNKVSPAQRIKRRSNWSLSNYSKPISWHPIILKNIHTPRNHRIIKKTNSTRVPVHPSLHWRVKKSSTSYRSAGTEPSFHWLSPLGFTRLDAMWLDGSESIGRRWEKVFIVDAENEAAYANEAPSSPVPMFCFVFFCFWFRYSSLMAERSPRSTNALMKSALPFVRPHKARKPHSIDRRPFYFSIFIYIYTYKLLFFKGYSWKRRSSPDDERSIQRGVHRIVNRKKRFSRALLKDYKRVNRGQRCRGMPYWF